MQRRGLRLLPCRQKGIQCGGGNQSLQFIHRHLALNDTYKLDDDIRLFFSDKFLHIKHTHILRSTIPISWPTEETLEILVKKSSG